MQQHPNTTRVEPVYRTNLILWATMFISQFLLLMVLYFAKPELFDFGQREGAGVVAVNPDALASINPVLIVLAVAGLSTFALSFVMKAKQMKMAVERQRLEFVQQGMILALALCEATSLFGLVAAFAFNSRFFFVWFIVGIIGFLLHFPRRENYLSASFKRQI